MSSKIQIFKNTMKGGGIRPNRFEVHLSPVGTPGLTELLMLRVRSTNLPGFTQGTIPMSWRGRSTNFAGDKTFDPWTITVLDDVDFRLRNAFERWSEIINSFDNNTGTLNPADYTTTAAVYQLDSQDRKVKGYELRGLWCSNVSPIDLSMDSGDTMSDFTVEFQIDDWVTTGVDGHNPSTLAL